MRLISETWEAGAVRTRSRVLFGSQHRLPAVLLIAAASREELFAACIAEAAGMTRMEATRQFECLRRAGLLARAGTRVRGDVGRPGVLFRRTDATAWAGLASL